MLALEEAFISMCQTSRETRLNSKKSARDVFVISTYSHHVCAPFEEHKPLNPSIQRNASIQSSINLGDTLLSITGESKKAET